MATLLQQNPWLRDPVSREKALRMAAASSSAVEGIRKPYGEGGGQRRSPKALEARRIASVKQARIGK
jgi:hypothetical protein